MWLKKKKTWTQTPDTNRETLPTQRWRLRSKQNQGQRKTEKETDAERHPVKQTHRKKHTVMGTQRKDQGLKKRALLSHRTT